MSLVVLDRGALSFDKLGRFFSPLQRKADNFLGSISVVVNRATFDDVR